MSRDAATIIDDGKDLTEMIHKDLHNKTERLMRGMRARELVMAQVGATARTVVELERLMEPVLRTIK
jgi:3-deoxy-D-manno-octulosonic-acid transferase